ncbi:MAG TPA: efflux RND transporter periplasmic adaptor subunit [Rhodocyclaceae bacterium]
MSLPAAAQDELIRLGPEQAKAAGIAVARLDGLRSNGERRLPAQVIVPPSQSEVVSAPIAGVVTAVKAAYGETVKRGQVMARMQGPQLLELQREFAGARAQADVAAEQRKRDESLYADGIISRSRLAVAQATDRQANALLAEKRAALRLAGMGEPAAVGTGFSGTATVRAPLDGVVLDAAAQPGQRVEATAVLFKLGRLSPLWLEIQASAAQAAGLSLGDHVAVPGCPETGKLTMISPHLNPSTQSLLLRAEFSNADGCLRPFQFINARIESKETKALNAWRVPNTAVVRHQGQAWLFAEAPGGYQPVPVRVIEEVEQASLVGPAEGSTTTLRADLRVVVKGSATIKAAWLGIGAPEPK